MAAHTMTTTRSAGRSASSLSKAQQQLLDTHDDYRYTTNEVIELARIYTVLDDVEHYQTTRLHPLFRRGALTLARRWLAQDALPCIDAIFCLDFDELTLAVEQGAQAVRAIAEGEWPLYLEARSRTPRWSLDEVEEAVAQGAGDAADENQRSGVPGSPGIVEGTIFIVRGTEDFGRMPAGAVLVARTTNPAWTPLFYRASAVITESGGQLSHGAVTARELGLPAVMSVRGVLQWLRDGDRVRVDGQRGRVVKLCLRSIGTAQFGSVPALSSNASSSKRAGRGWTAPHCGHVRCSTLR